MEVFEEQDDLKQVFPEVIDRNDLSRLLIWARDNGVKEDNRLTRFSLYYETIS